MSYPGCFITLEGIEGCGKSTHGRKLLQVLEKQGYPVILTKEPGGTDLGHNIRKLLVRSNGINIDGKTELFLYAADRTQHLQECVIPALAAGKIVICDRFTDATIAYQGYARGIDKDLIAQINQFVTQGLKPDLTLLLDLDVKKGLSRALGRNQKSVSSEREDRFEQEGLIFHEKVRQGYLALAQSQPDRIKVIDADNSVEILHNDIMAKILPLLEKHKLVT